MKSATAEKRLPRGRPKGIPQPLGPERIRRSIPVIFDSVLKRARAGEAESARLCIEVVEKYYPGEIMPEVKALASKLMLVKK